MSKAVSQIKGFNRCDTALVQGKRQHNKIGLWELCLKTIKSRHFPNTRRTPCRPKIQEDNPATKTRKRDLPTSMIIERERGNSARRVYVDEAAYRSIGGFGCAVCRMNANWREQQHTEKWCQKMEARDIFYARNHLPGLHCFSIKISGDAWSRKQPPPRCCVFWAGRKPMLCPPPFHASCFEGRGWHRHRAII